MSKKITLKTLEVILKEVDKASSDKMRVISDIHDRDAREIIHKCSDYSLKNGIYGLGISAGLGIVGAASGMATAFGGATAGGSLAAGGATIMSFAGGSVAAAECAAAGATAGSTVPVVGTIIGAGIGLLVGALFGAGITAKQKQKKERLYQEAISKQNTLIKVLTNEVHSLQNKDSKKQSEISRLKYLIGVLQAYVETRDALAA